MHNVTVTVLLCMSQHVWRALYRKCYDYDTSTLTVL
jgi:hypothetical protein